MSEKNGLVVYQRKWASSQGKRLVSLSAENGLVAYNRKIG